MDEHNNSEANAAILLIVAFVAAFVVAAITKNIFYLLLIALIELLISAYYGFYNRLRLQGPLPLLSAIEAGRVGLRSHVERFRTAMAHALLAISKFLGDQNDAEKGRMFTARSFAVCLNLSVILPFFLFMLGWAFGGSGVVGNISFLDQVKRPGMAGYIMVYFSVTLVLAFTTRWARKLKSKTLRWPVVTFLMLLLLAFNVLVGAAFSLALAEARGIDVTSVIIVLVSISFLVFVSIAKLNNPFFMTLRFLPLYFAMSALVAAPFVGRAPAVIFGLLFIAPAFWDRKSIGWLYVSLVVTAILAPQLITIAMNRPDDQIHFYARRHEGHIGAAFIVLFLGVLPVVNALLDWVSINVTRKIFRHVSRNEITLKAIAGWILIDLALAAALCAFVLGAIISFGKFIAYTNAANGTAMDGPQFDAALFLDQIMASGFSLDTLWLWGIIATGLLPSIVGLASITMASVFALNPLQRNLANALRRMDGRDGPSVAFMSDAKAVSVILASTMAASVAITTALLFLFFQSGCALIRLLS